MALEQREGEDLMNMMCGTLLGSGQYRHVYRARFDDKIVIKYEKQNDHRSNIFEFEFWKLFKDDPLGKWLAPCYQLSLDGTWLAQAYTEDIQVGQLPKKVPAIFCDLKPENWGMFEGRIVCRDYGNNLMHRMALKRGSKLVKVHWMDNGVAPINQGWSNAG